MRAWFMSVLVFGLVALLAGPSAAQDKKKGRGGFGVGVGMASLVTNEGVQKELKLADDQAGKAKEIADKLREKHKGEFAAAFKLDGEERRTKMQEILKTFNEETAKELGTVLKPEQIKRLKQIELQQRGSRAFEDQEVVAGLKISDDQKAKLKALGEESGKQMREIFQGAQGHREEAAKKFQALRKETMDKALAVLSDDQKKAWKELTGEPFEVKFERRQD